MAVRTCIGCGRAALRDELVRIVRPPSGGAATVDPARSAAGRGAWLCPSVACFDAAQRRRAFGRALRASVDDIDLQRLRGEFALLVAGKH